MTTTDSPAPEPHPFDGQFEPAAEKAWRGNDDIPLRAIAQASIAISLKRIADGVEGLQPGGDREWLFQLINRLAWEAGHSFKHGAR